MHILRSLSPPNAFIITLHLRLRSQWHRLAYVYYTTLALTYMTPIILN